MADNKNFENENFANDKEKKVALDRAIAEITKEIGKGAIMRLGERSSAQVEVFSSGSISLDAALGVGGIPRGRISEIFGPESSGKTTLALHVIAEAQKNGGVGAFIDAEHALDAIYAKRLGVDTDNLLIAQPDCGEQALEITERLVRSNAVDIIVVDSVAALVPRSEIDGEMGDATMGVQARLMSQAMRKLTGAVSKSKTCIIFINQIRDKIGVMFGNPETTTGGKALKFYTSIRIEIRRINHIKGGENVIGNRTKIKVVKNKLAPPFREVEVDLMYGVGISKEGDLIDLASNMNVIQKSGTWYAFGDDKLGQGRENAKQFLMDNPDILKKIETKVRQELGLIPPPAAEANQPAAKPAPTTAEKKK